MPTLTIKDGVISAQVYVQVTRDHICNCGEEFTITMSMPENVTVNGAIKVNVNCPQCGGAVIIPHGHHYVENYKLLTE